MLERRRSSKELSNNISDRSEAKGTGILSDLLLGGWRSQTVSGKSAIYYIINGGKLKTPTELNIFYPNFFFMENIKKVGKNHNDKCLKQLLHVITKTLANARVTLQLKTHLIISSEPDRFPTIT